MIRPRVRWGLGILLITLPMGAPAFAGGGPLQPWRGDTTRMPAGAALAVTSPVNCRIFQPPIGARTIEQEYREGLDIVPEGEQVL